MFYTAADQAQLASSAREGASICGGPRKSVMSAMQILQDNMSRANKAEATAVSTVVVTCMNI